LTNIKALLGIITSCIICSATAGWKNMPLVVFQPDSAHLPILFIHYSGDAGFNVTDNGIANGLLKNKIPGVGINSLAYFFNSHPPQEASADLADIISHFSHEWNTHYCIVSGYSFGADAVPFIVSALPDSIKRTVKLVVCTSPGFYADFSFHLTSWFGKSSSHNYPVVPEIVSLNKNIPVVCFYGRDDNTSSGPSLADSLIETHILDNGHRVGDNFQDIVSLVISRSKQLFTL
jgi:type IV secretory pathway VirJ component